MLHEQPGVTKYAASRISDEISAFRLLLSKGIEEVIICNTNLEGQRVYAEKWNPVDIVELEAYLGLLLLSGVSKSHNEAMENLWNEQNGRHFFRATMSLKRFRVISRVIRFDDRSTRAACRITDKLRDLWDKWVDIFGKLMNPGENELHFYMQINRMGYAHPNLTVCC